MSINKQCFLLLPLPPYSIPASSGMENMYVHEWKWKLIGTRESKQAKKGRRLINQRFMKEAGNPFWHLQPEVHFLPPSFLAFPQKSPHCFAFTPTFFKKNRTKLNETHKGGPKLKVKAARRPPHHHQIQILFDSQLLFCSAQIKTKSLNWTNKNNHQNPHEL